METRASYIAVGSFVLALFVGLLGFVVWIGKFQGQVELARYDILFDGSVTGLQVDGTVRYRGIAVGRVTDIRIDPENIEKIRVTIEVKADTPVRTDTVASIELQGITGGTYILLSGGTQAMKGLPKTTTPPYPVIPSTPAALAQRFHAVGPGAGARGRGGTDLQGQCPWRPRHVAVQRREREGDLGYATEPAQPDRRLRRRHQQCRDAAEERGVGSREDREHERRVPAAGQGSTQRVRR